MLAERVPAFAVRVVEECVVVCVARDPQLQLRAGLNELRRDRFDLLARVLLKKDLQTILRAARAEEVPVVFVLKSCETCSDICTGHIELSRCIERCVLLSATE